MCYVYVLLLRNKQLYKGLTGDLKKRVKDHHRLGKVKLTRLRRPLKLIHYEVYLLKSPMRYEEKSF